jgi:hypothetical protein
MSVHTKTDPSAGATEPGLNLKTLRLKHHADTHSVLCDAHGDPLVYARAAVLSGLSETDGEAIVAQLVARWNAVTEALEVLDDTAGFGASTLDARAILRRAMEG